MTTDNNNQGASAPEIPVPPGGGSWSWDGAKWISNDPAPVDEPQALQPASNNIGQEE